MLARSVVRLTLACTTPGCRASVDSILATHDAQLMPRIGSSTVLSGISIVLHGCTFSGPHPGRNGSPELRGADVQRRDPGSLAERWVCAGSAHRDRMARVGVRRAHAVRAQ